MTIAIDGKEIRSTEKMKTYDSPLHILSAHIGELGLPLAQKTVESKSNEIPAVPKLIKELEIPGCMVVADALSCQRETAEAVVEAKADYLLSVKGNQKELVHDIEQYVQDEKLRATMGSITRTEKRGMDGRKVEVRTRAVISVDNPAAENGRLLEPV